MIEVTESDRRAVRAFQKASVRYMHRIITDVSFGSALGEQQDDTHPIYQAFATHRIEAAKAERDRIVAWLRDKADDHKPFGTIQGDPTGCVLSLAACAIEESQP